MRIYLPHEKRLVSGVPAGTPYRLMPKLRNQLRRLMASRGGYINMLSPSPGCGACGLIQFKSVTAFYQMCGVQGSWDCPASDGPGQFCTDGVPFPVGGPCTADWSGGSGTFGPAGCPSADLSTMWGDVPYLTLTCDPTSTPAVYTFDPITCKGNGISQVLLDGEGYPGCFEWDCPPGGPFTTENGPYVTSPNNTIIDSCQALVDSVDFGSLQWGQHAIFDVTLDSDSCPTGAPSETIYTMAPNALYGPCVGFDASTGAPFIHAFNINGSGSTNYTVMNNVGLSYWMISKFQAVIQGARICQAVNKGTDCFNYDSGGDGPVFTKNVGPTVTGSIPANNYGSCVIMWDAATPCSGGCDFGLLDSGCCPY